MRPRRRRCGRENPSGKRFWTVCGAPLADRGGALGQLPQVGRSRLRRRNPVRAVRVRLVFIPVAQLVNSVSYLLGAVILSAGRAEAELLRSLGVAAAQVAEELRSLGAVRGAGVVIFWMRTLVEASGAIGLWREVLGAPGDRVGAGAEHPHGAACGNCHESRCVPLRTGHWVRRSVRLVHVIPDATGSRTHVRSRIGVRTWALRVPRRGNSSG